MVTNKADFPDTETLVQAAGVLVVVAGFVFLGFGVVDLIRVTPLQLSITLVSAGLVGIGGGIGLSTWSANRIERKKRLALKSELGNGDAADYFQRLVNINVENLSAYYYTVKSHANRSFIASLFVGIVGFALIGAGIALTLHGGSNGPDVARLSGVSGVATEFISAVFFYLYNRTVIQMKEYHDSLLSVQNILLSFKLVDSTPDAAEKAKMTEQMLQYLVRPSVTAATRKPGAADLPNRAEAQG